MSLFGQNAGTSVFGSNTTQHSQQPLFGAVNTSQAQPASNLFGSTAAPSQPAPSGGLFGSSTNTPQPQSGIQPSGFGGPTPLSQPQQSGGLFGTSSTSKPQQSGGLFGSAITSQPQQSGGLFGRITPSEPQQSTSLFGTTSTTSQPQSSNTLFGTAAVSQPSSNVFGLPAPGNQQQSSGLFGSINQPSGTGLFGTSMAQQSQAQPASSLFGGTLGQNQNQTQTNQGGGLLANAGAQSKPALSLFGASQTPLQNQPASNFGQPLPTQQQPQQSVAPLYGGMTAQSKPNIGMPFGLTLGQGNAAPQQQTVPGVKIDVSQVRGTTRFNDLHEQLQHEIEQIDNFIQQQISFKEQCEALMPAHEQNLSTIPGDVDFVTGKVNTVELALDNDGAIINQMKSVVLKDAENAKISFRSIENLKLPVQFHYSGIWHGTSSSMTPPRAAGSGLVGENADGGMDLVSYFGSTADDMAKALETYRRNLTEIEEHLKTVEASTVAQSQQQMFMRGRDGMGRSKDDQVTELATVLRSFEDGILTVAGKVGSAREGVTSLVVGRQDQSRRKY